MRLNYTRVIDMPDYKELYLKLFRASEDAIQILIKAQQECEEAVISEEDVPPEQKLILLPPGDQT